MFGQDESSSSRAANVRAVKDWARQALNLHEDTVILATELRCTEPGCPPLETVIAVMQVGGARQHFKIHKAIADIVYDDIEDAANRMLRGDHGAHSSQRNEASDEVTPPSVVVQRPTGR